MCLPLVRQPMVCSAQNRFLNQRFFFLEELTNKLDESTPTEMLF